MIFNIVFGKRPKVEKIIIGSEVDYEGIKSDFPRAQIQVIPSLGANYYFITKSTFWQRAYLKVRAIISKFV